MLVLFFILLASVNSFLLDNPQGNGGTVTTNQYLTLSKFYAEMELQQKDTANAHQETLKLRHDMENSFALLTTQLQQKFDRLDKKLEETERQNQTILDAVDLKQKYTELEKKYLNLEQNFNTLKFVNNLLQNKKDEMEHTLLSLQNETKNQGQELAVLKTKSLMVDQNIKDLKHLGNIKPLQEIQTLQQEIKSLSAQTSSLNMKEQARSQDFIALYSKVRDQGTNSTSSIMNLNLQMKTIQTNHNTSFSDLVTKIETLQMTDNMSTKYVGAQLKILQKNQSILFAEMETKMHTAFIRDNQTHTHLQRQIDNSKEQVSLIAHPLTSTTTAGIIKFNRVAFSVGINNLPAFKNTGKFVCENDGTYLISTSIASNTIDASYYIYLNGNTLSQTLIGNNSHRPSTWYYTGSVVLVLHLRLHDSVWVYYPGNYRILSGLQSTFTIVKI
ncbi:coiled-coil domain-containing protein 110-like [Mytilus edulis]|uniref:coiled-coil domain-containing protein 110-like n=1 Tax=Mytilus edulis TaxID=6550 RepID=UPI0039EE1752